MKGEHKGPATGSHKAEDVELRVGRDEGDPGSGREEGRAKLHGVR
jgi:hypothetical protein